MLHLQSPVMLKSAHYKHHHVLGKVLSPVLCGYLQMATVLIYLSAPEEGGETVFPLEGEHGLDRLPTIDYSSCSEGLRVCPLARESTCHRPLKP